MLTGQFFKNTGTRMHGVWFFGSITPNPFAEVYCQLRRQENRLLNDVEVALLPQRKPDQPHYSEWMLRARSAARVNVYLEEIKEQPKILEIGCGNGWFSNLIASSCRGDVIGVDVNTEELFQARRVFPAENIQFCFLDIFADVFLAGCFDAIFMNSSCQYFPDLQKLLDRCLWLLRMGGEIHILDSPFYAADEIEEAQGRSRRYFENIGHTEMGAYYFHHSVEQLDRYEPCYLYSPLQEKKTGKLVDMPFPWVRIRKT